MLFRSWTPDEAIGEHRGWVYSVCCYSALVKVERGLYLFLSFLKKLRRTILSEEQKGNILEATANFTLLSHSKLSFSIFFK